MRRVNTSSSQEMRVRFGSCWKNLRNASLQARPSRSGSEVPQGADGNDGCRIWSGARIAMLRSNGGLLHRRPKRLSACCKRASS